MGLKIDIDINVLLMILGFGFVSVMFIVNTPALRLFIDYCFRRETQDQDEVSGEDSGDMTD